MAITIVMNIHFIMQFEVLWNYIFAIIYSYKCERRLFFVFCTIINEKSNSENIF